MRRLLFVRHAETDLAGRFCGASDPDVNDRGRAQIAALTPILQSTFPWDPVQAVYSSDLRRAASTARAVAETFGCPVEFTPALREIDFGEWEGLSWEQIERADPVWARAWCSDYPRLPAPGGERFQAFTARVLREVRRLLDAAGEGEAARNGALAVVTHAGVLRVVLRELCGLGEQAAWERTRRYCGFFRYP